MSWTVQSYVLVRLPAAPRTGAWRSTEAQVSQSLAVGVPARALAAIWSSGVILVWPAGQSALWAMPLRSPDGFRHHQFQIE